MSVERELLKRWLAGDANQIPTHISLLIETQNLLAQPEQEPLSDEEIFAIGYKAGFAIDHDESADYESEAYGFISEDGDVDNEPYFKLVRAIEKAHGIGDKQ